MNKIHLLFEQTGIIFKLHGATTNEKTAEKWCDIKPKDYSEQSCYNFKETIELDNPELLNRIAKTKLEDKNDS